MKWRQPCKNDLIHFTHSHTRFFLSCKGWQLCQNNVNIFTSLFVGNTKWRKKLITPKHILYMKCYFALSWKLKSLKRIFKIYQSTTNWSLIFLQTASILASLRPPATSSRRASADATAGSVNWHRSSMLFQACGKGFRNKGFRSKITNPKQHQSSKAVVLRSPVQHHWFRGLSESDPRGELHDVWQSWEGRRWWQICWGHHRNALLVVTPSVLFKLSLEPVPAYELA